MLRIEGSCLGGHCAQGGCKQMKSNQPSPVWPYLGVLVCLFALAVTAPRGWQPFAHREPIGQFLKQRALRESRRQKLAARQWTAPPAAGDRRLPAGDVAGSAAPGAAQATTDALGDLQPGEQYGPIVMVARPALARQAAEAGPEPAEPAAAPDDTADPAPPGEDAQSEPQPEEPAADAQASADTQASDRPDPAEPDARQWPGEESEPR